MARRVVFALFIVALKTGRYLQEMSTLFDIPEEVVSTYLAVLTHGFVTVFGIHSHSSGYLVMLCWVMVFFSVKR